MNGLDTIREAARLMRERAHAATPGPWFATTQSARYGGIVAAGTDTYPAHDGYGGHLIGESMSPANRDHVAAWHPAVALAVADWLDAEADLHDSAAQAGNEIPEGWSLRILSSTLPQAVAVARAYLGEQQ